MIQTIKQKFRHLVPSGTEMRRLRSMGLNHIGLALSREPAIFCEKPSLRLISVFPFLVQQIAGDVERIAFNQVGVLDGSDACDLTKILEGRRYSGAMVEPQPRQFQQLVQNWENTPGLHFFNEAIDVASGERVLYLPPTGESVVASFCKEHLLKSGYRNQEIREILVQCNTLSSVADRAGLERVEVLQLDAEGYDHKIIQSIEFDRIRPKLIRFEMFYLSKAD
ncbi:MAG: FkbM family methyltransferase, partial [Planctomycetota bacterium]